MTDRSTVPRGTSKIDYDWLEERDYERLSRMLNRAGIGGGELALELEVASETVSRWRNGKQAPDDDTLRRIITLLAKRGIHVSIAWLRYGEREGASKPFAHTKSGAPLSNKARSRERPPGSKPGVDDRKRA